MLDRLESLKKRYDDLEQMLVREDAARDRQEFARLSKERAGLEGIVARFAEWQRVRSEIDGAEALLHDDDAELRELGRTELAGLKQRQEALEAELRRLLLPKDPNDERNVIVEIRAGTGGDEASLFAADLFRMYSRYAERHGWRIEMMSASETGLGGFKEVIALVEGKGAFSRLKFESGTHRVQRVPVTEGSGRIHTSAVTVAVLPEAEDVEVEVLDKDLRIEVMRASGPGGQSVNTTDSAVRITHGPTGIVVAMQDEKSQRQNRDKAMRVLRARLFERAQAEQQAERASERRAQVGTGERSEKVRTYNFPQGRVTDHRVKVTSHNLDGVLAGELDEFTEALGTEERRRRLEVQAAGAS